MPLEAPVIRIDMISSAPFAIALGLTNHDNDSGPTSRATVLDLMPLGGSLYASSGKPG
jgi:hypothetical protein